MKKYSVTLLLYLGLVSMTMAGDPVKSFSEMMQLLKNGEDLKVVIHYGKCQLISENEIRDYSPDAIGGMEIHNFEYFAEQSIGNKKAFMATSVSHLIENPIGEGYVYNYVKLKIKEDNSVVITARYLNSETKEEVMSEKFFTDINNGENDAGVYLFADW